MKQCLKYTVAVTQTALYFLRWVGNSGATGDYPFTHHKLSAQYFDHSAAQDRKLEDLVHTAVQELWRPAQSELSLATSGFSYLKAPPTPITLSGSSDPCFVEAYHLIDAHEKRLTLHLKVIIVVPIGSLPGL